MIDKPKANKKLGQHYLNNQTTISEICNDFDGKYDQIVEIGPGPATLTGQLAKKEKPLLLIEKDTRFIEILEQLTPEPEIINEDALELDIDEILAEKNKDNVWLVSNLPYNVGTPIMLRYMRTTRIKYMTLMFQKEVAQKIYLPLFGEKKMNKEMNSLHVLVAAYFDIDLLKKVPPGQFSPPPKVDSAVVSLQRKENPIVTLEEWDKFEGFLRKLFSNRRKQIQTVLKSYFEKSKLIDVFEQTAISGTLRSEKLSFEEVISLYRKLV